MPKTKKNRPRRKGRRGKNSGAARSRQELGMSGTSVGRVRTSGKSKRAVKRRKKK